jgi:large subunit ribosomal protein L15
MPSPATINVGELEDLAKKMFEEESITSGIELDLTELGIGKLLGRGSVKIGFKVRVETATNSAKEKLEGAGGSLIE